jgi:hypothetical protein
MLKIIGWIAGITFGTLALFIVAYIFSAMFRPQIENLKIYFTKETYSLDDEILIEEVATDGFTYKNEEEPVAGNLAEGKEMLLLPDGSLKEGRRVFDEDEREEVIALITPQPAKSIVLGRNTVYRYDDGKVGTKLGEFSKPRLGFPQAANYINKHYFIYDCNEEGVYAGVSQLWQVNYESLEKILLTDDAYYTFKRTPKVFKPDDFDGVVLVYYTGSHMFDYAGTASKPKLSHIRIYNRSNPDGKEIARFNLNAGTIVKVTGEKGSLILLGDPSQPGANGETPKPARRWKIRFKEKE